MGKRLVMCADCRRPRPSSPCSQCARRRRAKRRATDWYQSAEWRALKRLAAKVLGRQCALCGSRDRITYHHVIPREQGGPDALSNLVPICGSHHSAYEAQKRSGRVTELVKRVDSLKGGSSYEDLTP